MPGSSCSLHHLPLAAVGQVLAAVGLYYLPLAVVGLHLHVLAVVGLLHPPLDAVGQDLADFKVRVM